MFPDVQPGDEPVDVYATNAALRRKGKFIHDREELKAAAMALSPARRKKYRWLAAALDLPLSTVHFLTKQHNIFRKARSTIKPKLTVANKLLRIDHCLSKIDPTTKNDDTMKYTFMDNEIHIDEKWFYLCRDGESFILVADEEEDPPERYVKHKSHIEKVMFLCAQARPRHYQVGTRTHNHDQAFFDGKIGIWAIGQQVAAQRASVNRPAGTLEWRNENVDQEVYRALLLNEVFPAIADKWPTREWQDPAFTITLQQDGATTHIKPEDLILEETLQELEFPEGKVKLYTQPANSPDLNLNDLGFFNALQADYYKECPRNADELIAMVYQTYQHYPADRINRIWLTLQGCMNEIINSNGGNQYQLPHMNKDKLEREGRLPSVLDVTEEARAFL